VDEFMHFESQELLDGYLGEAAWFWFDASTHEKSFEAGLHQVIALCLEKELHSRGLDTPSDAVVFARARTLFPPDDLRAQPKG
jgi:hypothetical protein